MNKYLCSAISWKKIYSLDKGIPLTLLHKLAQYASVTQLCDWLQVILRVPNPCTANSSRLVTTSGPNVD